jgi:hypothetical protein
MAAEDFETTPPPHNVGAPPWPTYHDGEQHHPVSLYLVPGIQAPDIVDGDGTFHCEITNRRETLGPGIGTLFYGSFDNTAQVAAVSAAVMRMDPQAIRRRLLEQAIQEALNAQQTLLQALTALQADDLDSYVSLCHDVEGQTCLLAHRTGCLAGIIAIVGGSKDPLLQRYAQLTRTAKPKKNHWLTQLDR